MQLVAADLIRTDARTKVIIRQLVTTTDQFWVDDSQEEHGSIIAASKRTGTDHLLYAISGQIEAYQRAMVDYFADPMNFAPGYKKSMCVQQKQVTNMLLLHC